MGSFEDLPIELLYEIFSYFRTETHDLDQCALVSRTWNQAARQIFPTASIVVHSRKAVKLRKLLSSAACTISQNVECLTINGSYSNAPPDWRWNTSVQKIMNYFEGVSVNLTLKHVVVTLATSYLHPASIIRRIFPKKTRPSKPTTLLIDLKRRTFSPHCGSLDLNDIRFKTVDDMVKWISSMPYLSSLGVSDIEITDSQKLDIPLWVAKTESPFTSLKNIRLVGPGPATQAVVSLICKQKTVEIERCSLRDPMWADGEESIYKPLMEEFVAKIAPNLRALHLAFDFKGVNFLDTLDLGAYTLLTSLSMYLTLTPFLTEGHYDTFGVVHTLPSTSLVENVTLYIHFEFFLLQDISERIGPSMERVDESLARMQNLKNVVVIVLSVFALVMPDGDDAKAVVDTLMPRCKRMGILSVGSLVGAVAGARG